MDDVDFLVDAITAFNDRLWYVPVNPVKVRDHVVATVLEGLLFRTDKGFISGVVVDDPLRDWTVLVETGWYSEGRDGLRLLKAFEDVGKNPDLAIDEVRLTTLHTNPLVAKLLQRRGYTAIETSHRLLL